MNGVRSEAHLSKAADVTCVGDVMENLASIRLIDHKAEQFESYRIAPSWGKVTTNSDYWQYGPKGDAVLQITDDGTERKYRNAMEQIGGSYTASEIADFKPLMNRVNNALVERCGLLFEGEIKITKW